MKEAAALNMRGMKDGGHPTVSLQTMGVCTLYKKAKMTKVFFFYRGLFSLAGQLWSWRLD